MLRRWHKPRTGGVFTPFLRILPLLRTYPVHKLELGWQENYLTAQTCEEKKQHSPETESIGQVPRDGWGRDRNCWSRDPASRNSRRGGLWWRRRLSCIADLLLSVFINKKINNILLCCGLLITRSIDTRWNTNRVFCCFFFFAFFCLRDSDTSCSNKKEAAFSILVNFCSI